MRWICCAIIVTGVLVSACGHFTTEPAAKLAVIDWNKARAAHGQYVALQQAETAVKFAVQLREEQLVLGKQQLSLVQKMRTLKEQGQASFVQAEVATKLAEREIVEREQFAGKQRQAEATAAQQVQAARAQVLSKYQLNIVNLRLRLENVTLEKTEKAALLQTLAATLAAQKKELDAVERQRQALVVQLLAPQRQQLAQNLHAYEQALGAQLLSGNKGRGGTPLTKGPEELANLLQAMDKQIEIKEQARDQVREQIDQDITAALAACTQGKGYSLVLKNVRKNLQATDVTTAVCAQISKLKN